METNQNIIPDAQDPTLLKVNGSRGKIEDKEYVKKLANAILKTFNKHNKVSIRCIGAGAINNADKAIAIAMSKASQDGIELVEKKYFTMVKIKDSPKAEVTAILKEIIKR